MKSLKFKICLIKLNFCFALKWIVFSRCTNLFLLSLTEVHFNDTMAQISRKLWWWTETFGRSRDVGTWIRTLVNARCGTWTTKPAQWASARAEKEPNGITLPPSWEYLLIWHSGQIKGGSVESCTWYWNVDYLLNLCIFLNFLFSSNILLEFSSIYLFCPFHFRNLWFSSKSHSFKQIQVLNGSLDWAGKREIHMWVDHCLWDWKVDFYFVSLINFPLFKLCHIFLVSLT